jgi:diguanylate cyclase (GGDEF)-like protein
MQDPQRVLVLEHREADRGGAEQLLSDYELDRSWPCVTSPLELHRIAAGNRLSNELSGARPARSRDDFQNQALTSQFKAGNSCRVLVVDDDALVRARLSALLHASQYEVEVATTGEEALRALESTHCDIVLTDWQMPDMDGLALCRHIRLGNHQNYIYVLMLTIRDTEHDAMIGLAAGADDYIVKGAPINNLLARLEIGRRITNRKSPLRVKHRGDRSLSYTDPATGAHNLGYLVEHLPREFARSQRYGRALAILHCDIDGFRAFNDRFGRDAGDELLRTLFASADGCLRKCDWLARTSGAEFMIVLPETTARGAHCAANKLRRLFGLHPTSASAGPAALSVSIGVTAVDRNDAQSTLQVNALLRLAGRGTSAAQVGEKHGLN